MLQVAIATGRDVLSVAHDSYALTLYTAWHLGQQRRVDALQREEERYDMASLIGMATHQPKQIGESYERFAARVDRFRLAVDGAVAVTAIDARAALIERIRQYHAREASAVPIPLS